MLLGEVRFVIGGGSLANDAVLEEVDGEWVIQGDPTDAAFLVAEAKIEGLTQAREERFERVGEIPFSSERKLMSTLQADDLEGGIAVVTTGAPDVAARSLHRGARGGDDPSTERRPAGGDHRGCRRGSPRSLCAPSPSPTGRCRRASGRRPTSRSSTTSSTSASSGSSTRPAPRQAVAIVEATNAGVRSVMITGDHPRTAARIADELGIRARRSRPSQGPSSTTSTTRVARRGGAEVAVYARVAPEHKLRIVDALQEDGHVVAMTGDGVNDAPALKAADIGVAMGITGTDVTKEAADMILADDNFATIVARRPRRARHLRQHPQVPAVPAVLERRGGADDAARCRRSRARSGCDDTGEAVARPLLATQILWINLLTDSAPALALGVDPPPDDVMRAPAAWPRRPRHRPRHVDRHLLGRAGDGPRDAASHSTFGCRAASSGTAATSTTARTMAFTTLVLAQLFNCFNARSDRRSAFAGLFGNRWLWGAIALSLALQVAVVHLPVLNDAFGTTPLSATDWLICIGLASAVLWAAEAKKLVGRRP